MKKRFIILAIILTVFLTTSISAGIFFSQPQDYYNIGDIIKSNITIEPIEEGFISVTLNCDDKSMLISPNFYQDGIATLEFPLNRAWIENLTGECYFLAEYQNGISGKSRKFEISKKLDVDLSINSLYIKPGEEIIIEGTAKRLNGIGINGEVEITLPLIKLLGDKLIENEEKNSSNETVGTSQDEEKEILKNNKNGIFYGQIKDGIFRVTFTLPTTIPAGDYRIDVLAYEEKAGEKTSEGIARANLEIFQSPTSIDIALNNQNFDPGNILNLKPILKDQTEMTIYKEISVIITDEKENRIFEKIIPSEETVEYLILPNQSSGYYKITASSNNLEKNIKFFLNEKEIISYKLINETLIITNIGNIPYKKDIEIELDGKPFVRSLNLKLRELQEFKLTGLNKDYNIKITDGETEFTRQGVALTGHAIGIKEINSKLSLSAKPVIWLFLIIILGAGLIFLLKNVIKKKSFTYPFKRKKNSDNYKTILLSKYKKQTQTDSNKQLTPLTLPNQAEQVLVLKGEKTNAAVVVLKIKNKISKFSKESLERAIEPIYEKRGAVYEQGDYIFIMFSPLMTKVQKNEVIAAKAAEKIQIILKEHNKKYKDKIDFGISINSGEIINKIEDKKLKFTALGKLITAAKRLAEFSDKQILITKEAYEKGITEMKAEKRRINNNDIYELRRVVDHKKNQKFLKSFMERMDKENN